MKFYHPLEDDPHVRFQMANTQTQPLTRFVFARLLVRSFLLVARLHFSWFYPFYGLEIEFRFYFYQKLKKQQQHEQQQHLRNTTIS